MPTLIRCPFHPRVTAVASERPRSFCQKCRWQVTPKHAYTLDFNKVRTGLLCCYALIYCGNLSGNELTRNLSRNIRPQSSQLAEPPWTYPGLKNGISLRELISTLIMIIKKRRRGLNCRIFLPNSSHARKKPPPPPPF